MGDIPDGADERRPPTAAEISQMQQDDIKRRRPKKNRNWGDYEGLLPVVKRITGVQMPNPNDLPPGWSTSGTVQKPER